jgi:hypothetical protein
VCKYLGTFSFELVSKFLVGVWGWEGPRGKLQIVAPLRRTHPISSSILWIGVGPRLDPVSAYVIEVATTRPRHDHGRAKLQLFGRLQ